MSNPWDVSEKIPLRVEKEETKKIPDKLKANLMIKIMNDSKPLISTPKITCSTIKENVNPEDFDIHTFDRDAVSSYISNFSQGSFKKNPFLSAKKTEDKKRLSIIDSPKPILNIEKSIKDNTPLTGNNTKADITPFKSQILEVEKNKDLGNSSFKAPDKLETKRIVKTSSFDFPNSESRKRSLCESECVDSSKRVKLNNTLPAALVRPVSSKALPSENYLKIDIKKKCFSKGGSMKQRLLRTAMKRSKYSKKRSMRDLGNAPKSKGEIKCFECGNTGHWAFKCPKRFLKKKCSTDFDEINQMYKGIEMKLIPYSELEKKFQKPTYESFVTQGESRQVEPFQLINNKLPSEVRKEINNVMESLGIDSFRPGQEVTVYRTLLGLSTLCILPTGSGKSLCYQLPSIIFNRLKGPCISLIISPLISLMQDQVSSPLMQQYGCTINSTMKQDAKEDLIKKVKDGQYSFLLVSPEALVDSDWLLQPGRLPPISYVCIDEAHCLSDWSHHFRPTYLRVCSYLKSRLGVKSFLALSATCTQNTISNICNNLFMSSATRLNIDADKKVDAETFVQAITQKDGYLQPFSCPLPDCIKLTASYEVNRDESLLSLLTRPPFLEMHSILIYAATRDQTESLASFIRTSLKSHSIKVGRRNLNWDAMAYHAGQTSGERKRIQNKFMSGKLRIVVATNAFGMGIDKQDLQAVIHFAMPKSFENYIQEVGRVGRANKVSYAHVYVPENMTTEVCEANEIRRHIFANHLDRVLIKKFISKLFSTKSNLTTIDPKEWSQELDIQEETIGTLLAYLDLWLNQNTDGNEVGGSLIKMLPSFYANVEINCYGGKNEIARVSQRSILVSTYLSMKPSFLLDEKLSKINLDLVDMARNFAWQPQAMLRELSSLNWDNVDGKATKTGVSVDPKKWSWWIWIDEQAPEPEMLDKIIDFLYTKLQKIEKSALDSLSNLGHVVTMISHKRIEDIFTMEPSPVINEEEAKSKSKKLMMDDFEFDEEIIEKSNQAKNYIMDHFKGDLEPLNDWPFEPDEATIGRVRNDIRIFIGIYQDSLGPILTGRLIANVFHGISTPLAPSMTWSRVKRFWKVHLDMDWINLKKIATEEILS